MKTRKLLLLMLLTGCFGNNDAKGKEENKRKTNNEEIKKEEDKNNKEPKNVIEFQNKLNNITKKVNQKLERVKRISAAEEKKFHESLLAIPTNPHNKTKEVFEKLLKQAKKLKEDVKDFLAKNEAFITFKGEKDPIYLSKVSYGILFPEKLGLKKITLALPKAAEVKALEVIEKDGVEKKSRELKISTTSKDTVKNILKKDKKIVTITLNENAFPISSVDELINNIEVTIEGTTKGFALLNVKEDSLNNLSEKEKKEYIIIE